MMSRDDQKARTAILFLETEPGAVKADVGSFDLYGLFYYTLVG